MSLFWTTVRVINGAVGAANYLHRDASQYELRAADDAWTGSTRGQKIAGAVFLALIALVIIGMALN